MDTRLSDRDINLSSIRKKTLHGNVSKSDDQNLDNIPEYPKIRVDSYPKGKKIKVTSHESGNQRGPEQRRKSFINILTAA